MLKISLVHMVVGDLYLSASSGIKSVLMISEAVYELEMLRASVTAAAAMIELGVSRQILDLRVANLQN
jgi:hypothetical protein